MTAKQRLVTWEQAVELLRSDPLRKELVRHCFYDDPILIAAERYYTSSEWQAVSQLLPYKKGMALDIGAGRGISSFALAKEGWSVSALEPNSSNLVGSGAIKRLIDQAGLEVEIVNDWGESLPFRSNQFDLVYCRAVLHHAQDLPKLCMEIERVLRPGGVLLATREHVISKKTDLQAFLDNHPLHRLYGGEHAYLLAEYKAAIENSGLQLKKVLNPYQSDINTFPETLESLRSRISSKLRVVPKKFIPEFILGIRGAMNQEAGRLYSFLAQKR